MRKTAWLKSAVIAATFGTVCQFGCTGGTGFIVPAIYVADAVVFYLLGSAVNPG